MTTIPRTVLLALGVCGTFALAASCGMQDVVLRFDDGTSTGGSGGGTAGSLASGSTSGSGCAGDCVPARPPLPWDGPHLLWFGPKEKVALGMCLMTGAPTQNWPGSADLVAPQTCEGCSCVPLQGSCEMPTKITAVDAPVCAQNAMTTPFDAPVGWNGLCDKSNQIQTPNSVASLTVEPLKVVDSGCVPGMATKAMPPPARWATEAVQCDHANMIFNDCPGDSTICIPHPPPYEGQEWRVCVRHEGDVNCSDAQAYSEPHTFFQSYKDGRFCTACGGCGPMVGSSCSALVSVYKDDSCGGSDPNSPPVALTLNVGSAKSICGDVMMPGTPLLSKDAMQITYNKGTCEPTGGKAGGIAGADFNSATTFCCLPHPSQKPPARQSP
jgi:hypothetical protein